MTDRAKIGTRVDEQLWKRFREDVQARKGQVRGVLGDELENAIRQYLRDEQSPTEKRIDDRLSRIEHAVGASATDGGVDTFDRSEHTHAPSRLDNPEKPAANAATDKKLAYLAECVLDQEVPNSRELATVPKNTLRDVVKDEYGFRRDTAKRYVEQLTDELDLHPHPNADGILVSSPKLEELREQQREAVERDADERMGQLDQ